MKKIKTKIIELDDITLDETVDWVIDNSNSSRFNYVVTPNIDHLDRLLNGNENLFPIYESADLCLCDSRILKVMLKIKNYPIDSVVPGSDLTAALFNSDKVQGKRLLIFGADDSVFTTLQQRYPHLDLYHINPSMGFIKKPDEITALIEQIQALQPDILFLAVGSPQQEKFADKLAKHLTKGVALCIGASILFMTGEEKRAPVIIQKLHLEWFFRMVVAPRLIGRYWQNLLSLTQLYRRL